MKRRTFLTAGVAAVAAPMLVSACKGEEKTDNDGTFPLDFVLNETTIQELQHFMDSGKYTAEQLTELYLKRIEEIDRREPGLNSIIEINPDCLEIARQMDADRKSGKTRGPLHGIPVVIKDNIATADRMLTTAGSLAMADVPVSKDAFIVERLRKAGAIILGKSNLSEWANFRSFRSSSGWSGRGGQTHNPYITDRSPCGSSSGSAVAVSANLCAVAIGTETDGSIVCPSSTNGIVGIKPTLGLWSRTGIIPIAHSLDTAGPMTRTVADAAILLGILAGFDPKDEITSNSVDKIQDFTQFLDANGLKNARIGVARNFFGFHEKVDILMEEAISIMRSQGAVIIDPASIDAVTELEKYEFDVLLYEFKADLNKYLEGMPEGFKYRTLKDLIYYNETNRNKEMQWFEQEIFMQAEEKGPLSDKAYIEALANIKRLAGKEGIDATMQKYELDAIISPTGGPAWTIDLVNGDHFAGGSSSPAASAGYPAITVPAGFVQGLPVGITFMGTAWSEARLLKLAYGFEQATKHRKAPRFLSSVG
jgi:amidase